MRRALGWLLPGQGVGGAFPPLSCAAPAWLLRTVDALASGDARAAPAEGLSPISATSQRSGRGLATLTFATPASGDAASLIPDARPATVTSSICPTPPPSGVPNQLHAHTLADAVVVIHTRAAPSSSPFATSLLQLPPPETQTQPATPMDLPYPRLPPPATPSPPSVPDLGLDPGQGIGPGLAADPATTATTATAAVAELLLLLHQQGYGGSGDDGTGCSIVCTVAERSGMLVLVQHVANSYELVHSTTGLPWVASIPLTTLALRLALLPLSMRQARIIRSSFSLYKEALALTDLPEGRERQQHRSGADVSGVAGAGCGSATAANASAPPSPQPLADGDGHGDSLSQVLHSRLLRSHALLAKFAMLRRKVDAPHPAWLVVNPLVQSAVFVTVSAALGAMCRLPWPGLSKEGALWFRDLTQPAVVMETGEMPLGMAGLALPLLVYGMTMTSLRLGFGASGLAGKQQQLRALQSAGPNTAAGGGSDTTLAAFLRSLAPLLYILTTLNLYFKVQMPHGVLVHWLGSAGFTLSLQLALRNPALRAMLNLDKKLNPSAAATAATASTASPLETPSSSAVFANATTYPGGSSAGRDGGGDGARRPLAAGGGMTGAASSLGGLPADLVARVAETADPNVLVIMGAQLSARQNYAEALHCFLQAVRINPGHVRAHYSLGQVYALTGCWYEAEVSYRTAAELSPPGTEKGQALYCVATALHSQGKLEAAAAAYADADANWQDQTVISYGRVNALAAAGQREAAVEALAEAEARDAATPGRPFRKALARLRAELAIEDGAEAEGRTGVADGAGGRI